MSVIKSGDVSPMPSRGLRLAAPGVGVISPATPRLDDLMYFLALARAGRLVVAAGRLGVSHTTVSRRVTNLEGAVGYRLFDRTSSGWIVTDAGRRLLDEAVRVENVAYEALASLDRRNSLPSAPVRLVAPEAIGVAMLSPWSVLLRARLPNVLLELVTSTKAQESAHRQFDLAITLRERSGHQVLTRRLTDYALGLYASTAYLQHRGEPTSVAALREFEFTWYIESLQEISELRLLGHVIKEPNLAFQSTNVLAQQAAVANGGGIGLLPCFVGDSDARLTRILPQVEVQRTYWLKVHRDSARVKHVLRTADELCDLATANSPTFLPPGHMSSARNDMRLPGA